MRKLSTVGLCAIILLSGAAVPAIAGGASHGGGHSAASSSTTSTGHGVPNGYSTIAPPRRGDIASQESVLTNSYLRG
jgi:hypothetical protein